MFFYTSKSKYMCVQISFLYHFIFIHLHIRNIFLIVNFIFRNKNIVWWLVVEHYTLYTLYVMWRQRINTEPMIDVCVHVQRGFFYTSTFYRHKIKKYKNNNDSSWWGKSGKKIYVFSVTIHVVNIFFFFYLFTFLCVFCCFSLLCRFHII